MKRAGGGRPEAIGILLALALLASSGCGYTLVGQGSSLPPNIKVVQFTTLENRTSQVELEQRFSAAIARELVSRGRFRIQAGPQGADAELSGVMLGFDLFPVAFDAQGRATNYQVRATARVSLKTLPDGKPIWENPAFTFRDNYEFAATAATYTDLVNDAIDRVADRFAQSLVTSMLEGF